MAYDQITIQKQTFKVPLRYSAGHTLTENEANALNQTYHENLRNNFASKVRDGIEAGVTIEVLQQQLDDYANDYQFGVRTGGGGFRGDPVMTYAMGIAREVIRDHIKKNGLPQDEWPAEKVSDAAKQLLERQGPDGRIVTAARKQVEAEKAVAQDALSEVGEIVQAA